MAPEGIRESSISDASAEAVSGAMGSVVALLATYPLKTIYTSQALSAGQRGVAVASALDIIRRYKLSGLYVGIGPNVVESALSSGVYFYLYSRLRALAVRFQTPSSQQGDASSQATSTDLPRNAKIGVLASLLVAAVAGVGNQLCTMPASVVATRMLVKQKAIADAQNSGKGAASKSGGGMFEVISEVYKEGGFAAFWTGFIPSLILVANPAIQYMLYEQLLELFRRWKRQSITTSSTTSTASSADPAASSAHSPEAAEPTEPTPFATSATSGSHQTPSAATLIHSRLRNSEETVVVSPGGDTSNSDSADSHSHADSPPGGQAILITPPRVGGVPKQDDLGNTLQGVELSGGAAGSDPGSQNILPERTLPSVQPAEGNSSEAGNVVQSVQLSALEYFIASALAKVGATVATYPLIVVKLKEQFFNVSRTFLESLERFVRSFSQGPPSLPAPPNKAALIS
eukprot:gene3784-13852_t